MGVQTTGSEPTHAPAAHVSTLVHPLPSLQRVPFGAFGFEHEPVAVLQVPATWQASEAVQTTGLDPAHVPF